MTIWTITWHHRFGTEAWPVVCEEEPDLAKHLPRDYDAERDDEWLELHGPCTLEEAIQAGR